MFIEHQTQRQLFTGSVTATELFANSFTTLSANINVLDITMYEVSGFHATGPVSVTDNTNAFCAVTISQPGSGYAVLVNDELPDSTPVSITSQGRVGIGTLTPSENFTLFGNSLVVGTGIYKSQVDDQVNLMLRRSTAVGRSQVALQDEFNNNLWVFGNTDAGGTTFNLLNVLGTHISVLSSGRVGINNTTPTETLTVNGDATINRSGRALRINSNEALDSNIDFEYNSVVQGQFYIRNEFLEINGNGDTSIKLSTNNDTNQVVLSSNGNVGIGTSNASEKLTVLGSVSASNTGVFTILSGNEFFANNLRKPLNLNSHSLTNANIDSGAIDSTTIGTTTPTTGGFTTLSANTLGKSLDLNSQVLTNANIDSGNIDNTRVGGATPAAGSFTNLNATTLISALNLNNNILTNVNIDSGAIDSTTIGTTTPTTGGFTTLSANTLGKSLDLNSQVLTNANIDSGTVDGVTINGSSVGLTTQAQARFSTLTATGITITTVVQNQVYASPNGSTGDATFRALVANDIPNLDANKITSGTLPVNRGGTGATTFTSNAVLLGNGTGAFNTVTGLTTTLSALSSNNTPFRLTFTNGVLTSFGF